MEEETAELWGPVKQRLSYPFKQVTFWLVLLVGVLFVGYLAVWIEILHVVNFVPTATKPVVDLEPVRLAYATAILAVAAPCLMQLVLTEMKILRVAAIGLVFVVLLLAHIVYIEASSACWVHGSGLLGMALAVLAWWLANGEDPLLQDHVTPSAPSGGDKPLRKLPGGKSKVKT